MLTQGLVPCSPVSCNQLLYDHYMSVDCQVAGSCTSTTEELSTMCMHFKATGCTLILNLSVCKNEACVSTTGAFLAASTVNIFSVTESGQVDGRMRQR